MLIAHQAQIRKAMEGIDCVPAIEEAFVAYSQGQAVVPPVGELTFKEPPGATHIKYGYIIGDACYVIKIASTFHHQDPKVPAHEGMMLMFDQKTGQAMAMLLDGGFLTALRTAAAGVAVARQLAPKNVQRIGIFGAGKQGRLQLNHLLRVCKCSEAIVWSRSAHALDAFKQEFSNERINLKTTHDPEEVAATCNLIVTTTPATSPLLSASMIRRGTHITALGSDTPSKQELDPAILQKADVLVADSLSQCQSRGEIYHALKTGLIEPGKAVELGNVIAGKASGRSSDEQITIADLTGVAVQDIAISKVALAALKEQSS